MNKEYRPIEGEQLKMMNDLTQLVDEKYSHLAQTGQICKVDNIITMTIICAEEPIEVDDAEKSVPKVDDIFPEMLEVERQNLDDLYTREQVENLKENLFTTKMPLELGLHLLHCAIAEEKAANADSEKVLPNGRCLSLMLLAMYEMDCIVFKHRSDMTNLMSLINGSWVLEDKHFLDYFYQKSDAARVRKKIDYYKFCISNWLKTLK